MVVVVTVKFNAMVAGCVAAMMVPEEVNETEEGGGAVDKVRRLSTVLVYWILIVILQLINGPA